MIFLAILAILIGILINCLVISFLLKYPLNPSRLAGNEGEIGRRGLIGSKGRRGGIGEFGNIGIPGPRGDKGYEGHIGVRGQLFKFGQTSQECMNSNNCDWGKKNKNWTNTVDDVFKSNPSRISSTATYKQNSDNQDNLKDFRRGNELSNNLSNNNPIIQLRPCITCNNCDPPASWDSIL